MLMISNLCFALKISKPSQALESYAPEEKHPLKMSKIHDTALRQIFWGDFHARQPLDRVKIAGLILAGNRNLRRKLNEQI